MFNKLLWFIIFAITFLVLGFWPQICEPGQFHFAYVEEGYEKFESSFNPHELFRDWQILHADFTSDTPLIIIGNPKIQWNETNRDTEQPIPEGELISQLVCLFQIRSDSLWELSVYMYRDKEGFIVAYIWDKVRKSYRKLTNNI